MSSFSPLPRSINERLATLERRVDELQEAIERRKLRAPLSQAPEIPQACACPKCGVAFAKTMCFACPYSDCPAGIAPAAPLKV